MGCDEIAFHHDLNTTGFLLTHPVWDVTFLLLPVRWLPVYFYSHIPCGMWRFYNTHSYSGGNFYSHIPCGMWHKNVLENPLLSQFLLTHPVWDVTQRKKPCCIIGNISTHTSRVGCDYNHILHPSHGWEFLLTHPVWDVTEIEWNKATWEKISTHTSRVGCDNKTIGISFLLSNFYSHIPCGMWPFD